MKRAILLGTIAACTLPLMVEPRTAVAETGASDSRSLRAIAIEVLVLGIQGGATDEYAAELSGQSDNVAARVRGLESEGRAVVMDRIRLTTLENQKMLVQSGRTAPVATGRTVLGRGGAAQTSYQQQNFGTLLSGTANVAGDAIVVEFQIERSELEPTADSSERDDRFVPPATGSFTSQTTVRIRSGQTIVVSGLEETTEGESTGQLILASARLLDPPSEKSAASPSDAGARQVKIFALENASAGAAATVIRELAHDESGEFRVSVDTRTNSLIVAGKKDQLAVIEAVLLRLDTSETRGAAQEPRDEERSDSGPAVTKFDKMDKQQLQGALKRLQQEVLVAEETAKRAAANVSDAAKAHRYAADEERADALLRKIEAEAASHKPSESYKRIRSELRAAEKAYFRLLIAE